MDRSRAQGPRSTPVQAHYPEHDEADRSGVSPVIVGSAGLAKGISEQSLRGVEPLQRPSIWPRDTQGFGIRPNYDPSQASTILQPAWASQLTTPGVENGTFAGEVAYDSAEGPTVPVPGEGQESMMWYDQLFDSSFSVIDNPFLAAAQFDPSVDPTWSYLR